MFLLYIIGKLKKHIIIVFFLIIDKTILVMLSENNLHRISRYLF